MSGSALAVVIVVAIIVLIAIVALAVVQSRRRRALKERFGPEYDRTIDGADNKRQAEKDLRQRAAQREELDIRELSPAAASRYQEQWTAVQQRFVDAPAAAVRESQQLVTTVMRDRGYPTDDADERESMLSVDHADIVNRYRSASQVEAASQSGKATTEDLRQAMQHYRALFDGLLGSSLATVYGDSDDDGVPSSTARRGSPVSPDAYPPRAACRRRARPPHRHRAGRRRQPRPARRRRSSVAVRTCAARGDRRAGRARRTRRRAGRARRPTRRPRPP